MEDSAETTRIVIAIALSACAIAAGSVVEAALAKPAIVGQATALSDGRDAIMSDNKITVPDTGKMLQPPLDAAQADPPSAEKLTTIETDRLTATFSSYGGSLMSLKLKGQKDGDGLVDLVVPSGEADRGLRLRLGDGAGPALPEAMDLRIIDDKTIEYSCRILISGAEGQRGYRLTKTYSFASGDYLFRLAFGISEQSATGSRSAELQLPYRLSLGPQIGPLATRLDGSSGADYRGFASFSEGKKRERKIVPGKDIELGGTANWAALVGKYFVLVAVPDAECRAIGLQSRADPALQRADRLSFSGSLSVDRPQSYTFYFGPKTKAELGRYDYAGRNAFGLSGLSLESAIDRSSMLGWLEEILSGCLRLFHGLAPNYGLDIILVTVLVKSLLFPAALKAARSSARMQALQPKVLELQERYKNDSQKLSLKMADLYREEDCNPLSAFVPLLVQVPIFIALYNIFNNSFELRGAEFIPGWIADLSRPDAILEFAPLDLGVLKIEALRGLPVVYLLSQFLYGKYAQTATPSQGQAQAQVQAKLMLYGMPTVFFFILYDVPSGLLVYWIASNLISLLQQALIAAIIAKRRASNPRAEGERSCKEDCSVSSARR
jgi:membrane protein insertase, YidC/Oxa1 family, N-terminal domain